MFYVKLKVSDECSITIDITDENVFTRCMACGKEIQIDIAEIFEDGGDLYGTHIFCKKCSEDGKVSFIKE